MKILQLCFRVPYPLNDGGAIAVYNMAKGFRDHGVDLSLLTYNTKKHYFDLENRPPELDYLGDWHWEYIDASVKPLGAFLNLFSKESYNISRFDQDSVRQKLKALLQKNDYDIVHFEGLFTSMYVDDVKKWAPKSKTVLRQHNIEYLIWERMAKGASFPKNVYLNLLTKRLKAYELKTLRKFDAIVPITSVDKDFFAQHGVKKQFVSSTGVEPDEFVVDLSKREEQSVFHLGALNWMPNQEGIKWFMDDVWPLVIKERPHAKFYVAGRDMPDWINQYSSEPGIEIVGEVPDAKEFMNSKGVMVVPLHSGSGMRIKIIEGMAMAKAIVSTSVGAEGINVESGKDILIADNKALFAKNIIALLDNEDELNKLGRNARETVEEQYSNTAKVGELLKFYKTLIE